MTKVRDLHRKWMKDKKYRKAHEELAAEFALARAVIAARAAAGLTQEELAQRMDTTQPFIARLESGRTRPSTQTLERLATARVVIERLSGRTVREKDKRPEAQLSQNSGPFEASDLGRSRSLRQSYHTLVQENLFPPWAESIWEGGVKTLPLPPSKILLPKHITH